MGSGGSGADQSLSVSIAPAGVMKLPSHSGLVHSTLCLYYVLGSSSAPTGGDISTSPICSKTLSAIFLLTLFVFLDFFFFNH